MIRKASYSNLKTQNIFSFSVWMIWNGVWCGYLYLRGAKEDLLPSSLITRRDKKYAPPFCRQRPAAYRVLFQLGSSNQVGVLVIYVDKQLVNGRFQTLFRESVKFSNNGKILWPCYFAWKVVPYLQFWANRTLSVLNYWWNSSRFCRRQKYLKTREFLKTVNCIGISVQNYP